MSIGATQAGLDMLRKKNSEIDKLRELIHLLGSRAVYVYDNLEDDGDQCRLGSTNHADVLLKMKEAYDAYRFETGDMGGEDALSD